MNICFGLKAGGGGGGGAKDQYKTKWKWEILQSQLQHDVVLILVIVILFKYLRSAGCFVFVYAKYTYAYFGESYMMLGAREREDRPCFNPCLSCYICSKDSTRRVFIAETLLRNKTHARGILDSWNGYSHVRIYTPSTSHHSLWKR